MFDCRGPLGDLVVLVFAQGVEYGAPALVTQVVFLEVALRQRVVDFEHLSNCLATCCAEVIVFEV